MIKECLANIECKVIDIIDKHHIVVLSGVAAYVDVARKVGAWCMPSGMAPFLMDHATRWARAVRPSLSRSTPYPCSLR